MKRRRTGRQGEAEGRPPVQAKAVEADRGREAKAKGRKGGGESKDGGVVVERCM